MTKNTIYREFRNNNSKLLESEGDLVGHYGDAGSAALHEAREGHEAVGVRDGEQPRGHGAAAPKDKEIAALKAQMTGAERCSQSIATFPDRYQGLDARVKDAEAKLAAEKETSAGLKTQVAESNAKMLMLKGFQLMLHRSKSSLNFVTLSSSHSSTATYPGYHTTMHV